MVRGWRGLRWKVAFGCECRTLVHPFGDVSQETSAADRTPTTCRHTAVPVANSASCTGIYASSSRRAGGDDTADPVFLGFFSPQQQQRKCPDSSYTNACLRINCCFVQILSIFRVSGCAAALAFVLSDSFLWLAADSFLWLAAERGTRITICLFLICRTLT